MAYDRNTHLLDWLTDGYTHCQHGSKGWCEAYLHNARDTILDQDDALAAKDTAISEMRAELELARNALEDAEDTLHLVELPAFRDPRYGDEVEALGLRIGFGALMASASASWREHLAADGDPVGGEFVAGPCHGTVVATLAKIRAARALSQDEPADLGAGG